MQLATERQVLERMNMYPGSGTSTSHSITSALDSATNHLESVLRTPLSLATRVDYFTIMRGTVTSQPYIKLWLHQRFIRDSLQLYISTGGEPVQVPEATPDPADTPEVDISLYRVNIDEGSITMPSPSAVGLEVVAVRYTAGYVENESVIPDWLRNAAIESSIAIQATQSSTSLRKSKKDVAVPLQGLLYDSVNEHILTPYGGLFSDRSVVIS